MIRGSWRNVRLLPRPERLSDAERLRLSPTRTGLDSESTFDFRLSYDFRLLTQIRPEKFFRAYFFCQPEKLPWRILQDGQGPEAGPEGAGDRQLYTCMQICFLCTCIQIYKHRLCCVAFCFCCFHAAKHDNILQYALFIEIWLLQRFYMVIRYNIRVK